MLCLFILYCFTIYSPALADLCPARCTCTKTPIRPTTVAGLIEKIRIKCGGDGATLSRINDIQLEIFTNQSDVVNLDLSGNNFTYLPHKAFPSLEIQKLDLTRNHIEIIEDGAFLNLASLKRLDLSNNVIKFITFSTFEGLNSLEKLKLSNNKIRQVKEGSFELLLSLKQLDLVGNPLLCDCDLLWLEIWANEQAFKLLPMPKCAEPPSLKDQPLKKLKSSLLQCFDFPTLPIELFPDRDQVVFEGDPLKLDCRVSLIRTGLRDTNVEWYWAGLSLQDAFPSSALTVKQHTSDNGFIESSVIIEELNTNHTGEWNCESISKEGNHSETISIIVISGATKYCRPIVTKDNKGEYFWPKTVAGHVVELPCTVENGFGFARNNCTLNGQWVDLNTSSCLFVSETTRILQQYAKMNLTAARNSILESVKRLLNYTLENKHLINDQADIVFLTQTINNYLDFVSSEQDLSMWLMDLISNIMDLDEQILSDAQMRDRSCTKLIAAIETIAQHHVEPLHSQNWNMAIEKFKITRESFLGMTCTWFSNRDKPQEKLFHCSPSNASAVIVTHEKAVEASIQIPASLFHHLEMKGKPPGAHQLIISIYYNSKLFPTPFNLNRTVLSPIVGAKLVGLEVRDLIEPTSVMLSGIKDGVAPAWWDESLGDWVIPPCHPSHFIQDLLVTSCHHLGYFALISDTKIEPTVIIKQNKSKLNTPAVFVGTFIGTTCLLVAAFTYAVCRSSIQMSDKMKHSLANTWIAISVLSIVFNLGIYQTEDLRICQIIGLLLHYLALCSLFWMAVSINGMHRAFAKMEPVLSSNSDDGSSHPKVAGQPIVGLYLVGWGVSALLVGLSGAVNPHGYASPSFCSLGPGPGFTPVIVPVSALFIFIFTRAIMVRSAAVEKDSNAQLSEGTQATDLELLETGVPTSDRISNHSIVTPSSQMEDIEHHPYIQLKAYLIVILFFILSWTAAALSVIKPFHIPYEETIFGAIYSVFFVILGSFVIFFYCFSRSDVRAVWFTLKHIKRSRNVTDFAPPPIMNSHDSGRKSISPRPEPQGEVVQKTNFVDLYRRQYHHSSTVSEPNTFYNPQQSIVARKFFKKQRRKRNSLGRRRGVGDGTPVSPDNSELFHLGCKSLGSVSLRSENKNGIRDRPLERLVIGAESSRPTMRDMSTNIDSSVKYASVASECCSCLVSEAHSVTDCTRDLTSEHSSRSSHVYATVAPDMSPLPHHKLPRLSIDLKNESVRLNKEHLYEMKSSDEEKQETSV